MHSRIKLGIEEWKELIEDLDRITEGEPLEIVINLTLVHSHEGPYEHHNDVNFVEEITKLVDYISNTYNVEVHQHLHSHHGSVTFSKSGNPRELIKILKDILDYVKLNCECVLHTVDGEFHLGQDISGIYFGDSYKITTILPHSDGKRLKIHELYF